MNISDTAFRLETRIALAQDEVHLWHVDLAIVPESSLGATWSSTFLIRVQLALLAFARGRALGLDVEQLRENFDHKRPRADSFQNSVSLWRLAPSERYRGFFRCWTRKEAYIKAQGAGPSPPLPQFDVPLKAGGRKMRCFPPAPTTPK